MLKHLPLICELPVPDVCLQAQRRSRNSHFKAGAPSASPLTTVQLPGACHCDLVWWGLVILLVLALIYMGARVTNISVPQRSVTRWKPGIISGNFVLGIFTFGNEWKYSQKAFVKILIFMCRYFFLCA